MSNRPLTASSSTAGFFQAFPSLPPQYTSPEALPSRLQSQHHTTLSASDDKVLARIIELYVPTNSQHVTSHIHRISRVALNPSVLVHSTDAEINQPVLRSLTTFGEENRNDPLWTTTGWQKLKDIGIEEGVIAVAYEKENTAWNRRIYQFALGHMWICTGTMTGNEVRYRF